MKANTSSIFDCHDSNQFNKIALEIFHFQVQNNAVYKQYVEALKINRHSIVNIKQIPFLPIEFFKSHNVISNESPNDMPVSHIFESSGTTGIQPSKHFVQDISIYENSFRKGFDHFYGNIEDYCVLALLPSYLERKDSSLIYMCNDLINRSKHPESDFYLNNYKELLLTLEKLENQKTLLIGVSFALLDLAEMVEKEKKNIDFSKVIIMETGGMKGKREELIREELHKKLSHAFGLKLIHSEYGMTELLSQAYSKGNGIFNCPPWMRVLIRDTNDPFAVLPDEKTGGINLIDLANINSCSFIATQDLGKIHNDNSFEVLGRFDNSDIRGCNLLVG